MCCMCLGNCCNDADMTSASCFENNVAFNNMIGFVPRISRLLPERIWLCDVMFAVANQVRYLHVF